MLARILGALRRYLVTGLIVVAPLGVTAFVLVWLFQWVDSLLGRHLATVGVDRFPGLGIVVLLVLLVFAGWMLRWAVGRKLVGWWNSALSRFPLTRSVYNASSQITQTVLARKEKLFQGCALVEWPVGGAWSLVFITARSPAAIESVIGGEGITVFMPTAPNPASGYVMTFAAEQVRVLDLSVEEGMKMVLSAGAVSPGREDRPMGGLDLERLVGEAPARPAGPGFRRRRRRSAEDEEAGREGPDGREGAAGREDPADREGPPGSEEEGEA